MGGTFVLRIEDTDQERSTDESYRAILESMKWLGLDWDEGPEVGGSFGPYSQMERLAIYKEYAEKLVAEGKAYRCYATKEELDALRKAAEAKKQQFFYPHLWRDKTPADWPEGKPYVIRFKAPLSGATTFDDLVFGKIVTPNDTIQDFVLLRSDGLPLYNFGAVVDDMTMQITLVARGRDHMINTPPQVLLYEALGYPVPQLAHLPMMLAPDGKKLSKREAERYDIPVSVMAYRDRGFTADALLDYLVRFGWSHGDQEIFTRKELIELFSFDHVSKADGKFDMKKCLAISHKLIKSPDHTTLADYTAGVRPFLEARGVTDPVTDEALARTIPVVRERVRTFVEAADALDYFFRDPPVFDEKAKATYLVTTHAQTLADLGKWVGEVPAAEWAPATIEAKVVAELTPKGLATKDIAHPARVALTGRGSSPGLFDVIAGLGQARAVARLASAAALAAATEPPAV
jgi:glutamyl-tRNA synthetase